MDINGEDQYVGILKIVLDKITFYFIDNEHYFTRIYSLWGYIMGYREVRVLFQSGFKYPSGDRIQTGSDPLP